MALDFHAVIQHPANADQIGPADAVEQKVAWPAYPALFDACPVPAMPQMVATHPLPKFRSARATGAFRTRRDVFQTSHQKRLVSPLSKCAKLVPGVSQKPDDILFSRCRQPKVSHRLTARGPPAKRGDIVGQFVFPHVAIPPFVEVAKANRRGLLQRVQLGRLSRFALFDQAQSFPQHFARILVATGADQGSMTLS